MDNEKDKRSLLRVAAGIGVLIVLVLLVDLLGGLGVVLAIVIVVVAFLWLLPPEITGWNR